MRLPEVRHLKEAGLVAKVKAGKEILFVNERLAKLLAN